MVSEPKKEELRNLRSSSEMLFIDAFDRFRRSRLLLISGPIKNYCLFLSVQCYNSKFIMGMKAIRGQGMDFTGMIRDCSWTYKELISDIESFFNLLTDFNEPPQLINLFSRKTPPPANLDRLIIIFYIAVGDTAGLENLFAFLVHVLAS